MFLRRDERSTHNILQLELDYHRSLGVIKRMLWIADVDFAKLAQFSVELLVFG